MFFFSFIQIGQIVGGFMEKDLNLRAYFFVGIQRIYVWRSFEFLDMVKFLDFMLYLNIEKFHKKTKGLKFQKFQMSFETFR